MLYKISPFLLEILYSVCCNWFKIFKKKIWFFFFTYSFISKKKFKWLLYLIKMVDTENQLYPLTPLEEEDIDSPLSGEFLQDMENIQDLSQSLGDDSSGALSLTEFQSLGNGPGSDGSVITGKRVRKFGLT